MEREAATSRAVGGTRQLERSSSSFSSSATFISRSEFRVYRGTLIIRNRPHS